MNDLLTQRVERVIGDEIVADIIIYEMGSYDHPIIVLSEYEARFFVKRLNESIKGDDNG